MADDDTSTRPDEAQSTVAKVHQGNPYLKHAGRGPYEIGNLLRNLPPRTPPLSLMTDEDRQMAEAVEQHANNGINTLLWGLEAIGALMVDLGADSAYQMNSCKVSALGDLIQHLAVEVQFLKDTEAAMQEEMNNLPPGAPAETGERSADRV